MKYQAVLFDFDYTLGDTTVPITLGYQQAMTAMGWPPPSTQAVQVTIGMTLPNGYTHLSGDHDEARRQEFFERFSDAVGERASASSDAPMVRLTKLFPGALELLRGIKEAGISCGIVSTKLGAIIQKIFDCNQAGDLLDVLIGVEDVDRFKPDPQGLLKAVERLGLKPEHILFCGDTIIDAQTAQAAGTDFCAVLNGVTPPESFEPYPHAHIAPDLWDLKGWLDV